MRKIIVSMMVSVDGFIEGPDPEAYWHHWNEEMSAYMMDFFNSVDTFIYGRIAYEQMIAYWPQRHEPFATIMNETAKLVVSKTLDAVTWNASVLKEVNPGEIKQLKAQPGKDMVIFGGAEAVNAFRDHQLIDEYRLIVNPLLLGGGKPFFQNTQEATALRVKEIRRFECGNVLLVYEPALDRG